MLLGACDRNYDDCLGGQGWLAVSVILSPRYFASAPGSRSCVIGFSLEFARSATWLSAGRPFHSHASKHQRR